MITAKPTEHLSGITLSGDYQDFTRFVDAVYDVACDYDSNFKDPYYGVKNMLLAVCYDVRHAYMGDREVILVENGINNEILRAHKLIAPQSNVYYSVNILFPQAVFVAAAIPTIVSHARSCQHRKNTDEAELPRPTYRDLLLDQAVLFAFSDVVFAALAEAIGDDAVEKLEKALSYSYLCFEWYAVQYIDKCNLDLLKVAQEKRVQKLKSLSNSMIKKTTPYQKMESELRAAAIHYNCSIYEIQDERLEYPEEIEW
jgi:hypothetical protein